MKPGRHIALLRLARLPLAIAAAFVLAAPAHTEDAADAVYSIVVPYGSSQQLGQLTKLLDHPFVDQKTNVVKAEVGAEELAAVRALGFTPQIDAAETARIQNFVAARSADLAAGKLTDRKQALSIANGVHSCYRTVEEVYHTSTSWSPRIPKFAKTAGPRQVWMGTQQVIPPVGTAVPDNSRSSFANLLIRYLPAIDRHPLQPEPVPGRSEPGARARRRQLREAGRQGRAAAEHGLDRRHPCARVRAAGGRHQVHRVAARELPDRRRTRG